MNSPLGFETRPISWTPFPSSIRRECLDHMIVLSECHLKRALTSYLAYYRHWRTHLGLAMDSPEPRLVQSPMLGPV
jgi:putative transposase